MQQSTVTLIVAGLGIVGTFGGSMVSQFLTRATTRQQWLMDNKKQEFRELLTALSAAYMKLAQIAAPDEVHPPELKQQADTLKVEAYRILRDRLYIAEEVAQVGALDLWDPATHNLQATKDFRTFAGRFTELQNELVAIALERTAMPNWTHRVRRAVRDRFRGR